MLCDEFLWQVESHYFLTLLQSPLLISTCPYNQTKRKKMRLDCTLPKLQTYQAPITSYQEEENDEKKTFKVYRAVISQIPNTPVKRLFLKN